MRVRHGKFVVLGFGLFLAILLSFPPRILALWREFSVDEMLHNVPLLGLEGWNGFLTTLHVASATNQPSLDYLLRVYFWFPVFGHQEIGFRLPSLVSSFATVGLVSFFGVYLVTRNFRSWAGVFAGLVPSLWIAGHSTEIYYGAESHHYAFTSLLSVLFVITFVFFGERRWLVSILGSIFCGTHYFAIPLVGMAQLYAVLSERARAGRFAVFRAAAQIGVSFSLVAAAWVFNRIYEPTPFPGNSPLAGVMSDPLAHLRRFVAMFAAFLSHWEFPLLFTIPALVWLGFVALRSPNPELADRSRRVLILLAGCAGFFLAVVCLSDYVFQNRYNIPFFGVGVAFLILLLLVFLEEAPIRIAQPPILALVVVLFGMKLVKAPGSWALPAANYTEAFRFFERVKKEPGPFLFVFEPCADFWFQHYHWNFVATPGAAFERDPLYGPEAGPLGMGDCVFQNPPVEGRAAKSLGAYLEDFFRRNPNGLTVFYNEGGIPLPSYNQVGIITFYGRMSARRGIRSLQEFAAARRENMQQMTHSPLAERRAEFLR